jgi:lipid-binding SYLF domain-containing protein
MTSTVRLTLPLALALGVAMGCSTAPPSAAGKDELIRKAAEALRAWDGEAPGLEGYARQSYGYALFPRVAKGALGVGAAWGRGVVYEQDRHIGYADLSQASLGLQIGGQAYQMLMVFDARPALERFKQGRLDFSAAGSGVVVTGYAASVRFAQGITVFARPIGGVMGEASIGGQWSTFAARDDRDPTPAAGAPR